MTQAWPRGGDPQAAKVSGTPTNGQGLAYDASTGFWLPVDLASTATFATDAELASGLATKSDTGHTHTQLEITGLTAALAAKQDAATAATDAELTAHADDTTSVHGIADTSALATDAEVAAGYQPLDSDLTAIAALTTTAHGRGLLDDADAAASRTTIGAAATSHSHAQADVTSLVSDLAAKAPLASPTFTGTPAAPTPTAGDNDTSLATTAFVTTAVAGAVAGDDSTVGVAGRRVAVQSVPSGANTDISWDTQDVDDAALFAPSSVNLLTADQDGWWDVSAFVTIGGNSAGIRRFHLLAPGGTAFAQQMGDPDDGSGFYLNAAGSIYLTAGQQVKASVFQNSGVNLDVTGSFQAVRRSGTVGPQGPPGEVTDAELAAHADDTTNVHGIADTSAAGLRSAAGLGDIAVKDDNDYLKLLSAANRRVVFGIDSLGFNTNTAVQGTSSHGLGVTPVAAFAVAEGANAAFNAAVVAMDSTTITVRLRHIDNVTSVGTFYYYYLIIG